MNKIEQRKEQIFFAKKSAQVLNLREWYNPTNYSYELEEYFKYFSNLCRLSRELHKLGVKPVTKLYKSEHGIFVEANFIRNNLDLLAPLGALAYLYNQR
ncbi:hypothetical protein ACT41N_06750 [Acinetobacter baumannii]